jgi:ribosomal protein L31
MDTCSKTHPLYIEALDGYLFNTHPLYIEAVSKDLKKFEDKLKQLLQRYSFYSLQKYFCYK